MGDLQQSFNDHQLAVRDRKIFDDNAMAFFNRTMVEIVTRADLESRVIQKAIICELLKTRYLSFESLKFRVTQAIGTELADSVFRNHITFTNSCLRAINNLNPKQEVLIAEIYEITVEHNEKFFSRMVLVHNLR